MDKFREMQAFVSVAELGSFVAAAEQLGSSKTAISRAVSELEERLSTRLMQRTTRTLSLTPEGLAFLARCKEALAVVEEAEDQLRNSKQAAVGLIRINAPVSFGISHLAPLWGQFAARYPKVQLDITLSDRVVDIVDEGFDIAIRIARKPNSSLISRKLADLKLVLCASPDYLKRYGTPKHPLELQQHQTIAYSYLSTGDDWVMHGPEGEIRFKTHPRIRANNGETCHAAALAGQGITLQPSFIVGNDVASGALIELMPEFRVTELEIAVVYPSRKLLSPRVRALVDFLVEQSSYFANCSAPTIPILLKPTR
jgi:DNA-binding transcriptional LysR family regulator